MIEERQLVVLVLANLAIVVVPAWKILSVLYSIANTVAEVNIKMGLLWNDYQGRLHDRGE